MTATTDAVSGFVLRKDHTSEAVNFKERAVLLQKGDLLVTKSSTKPTLSPVPIGRTPHEPGTVRLTLPYGVHFLGQDGTVRHSHVVEEIGGGGMRVSGASAVFTTTLYVELEDDQDQTSSYPLPLPARILITAAVDQVRPDTLEIQQTSVWSRVELQASNPDDPVRGQIRASNDPDPVELSVPVIRPRIEVRMDPPTIQGLGLETATVLVQTNGLPNPSGRDVTLGTGLGRLVENRLKLNDSGIASTLIRSGQWGEVVLEAASPPLAGARVAAGRFEPPIRFLVFALLGGAFGGLLRIGAELVQKARLARRLALHAFFGSAVGFAVALPTALGINVLPFHIPAGATEGFVFVAAMFGALFGVVRLMSLGQASASTNASGNASASPPPKA